MRPDGEFAAFGTIVDHVTAIDRSEGMITPPEDFADTTTPGPSRVSLVLAGARSGPVSDRDYWWSLVQPVNRAEARRFAAMRRRGEAPPPGRRGLGYAGDGHN